jgi:1-acyl-sn-glycerol-3-phosphate acyltransferase
VGEEHIPTDKPFLIVPNHQNAFLDALILGGLGPRPLHFLTRQDVFTKKTTPWLSRLNMLPVYRIRDGFGNLEKNQAIFKACHRVFERGGAVMIFPEGNHGEHHFLRPLTKGAARLVMEAQAEQEQEIRVVPCGINFFAHRTPRTRLTLVYGESFSAKDFLTTYQENQQAGLKALKEEMARRMKDCLVIPEPSEDYEVKVKKVLNLHNQGLSFKKLRELAARDYRATDAQFVNLPKSDWHKAAVWLASVPNWGPYWTLKKILEKFEDRVFWGSMKFVTMLVLMPVWWLLGFLIGLALFGFWEGVVLVFLSLVGLFARAELLKQ